MQKKIIILFSGKRQYHKDGLTDTKYHLARWEWMFWGLHQNSKHHDYHHTQRNFIKPPLCLLIWYFHTSVQYSCVLGMNPVAGVLETIPLSSYSMGYQVTGPVSGWRSHFGSEISVSTRILRRWYQIFTIKLNKQFRLFHFVLPLQGVRSPSPLQKKMSVSSNAKYRSRYGCG